MTGWKLTAARLAAMVGVLIAGIGVSTALADPGQGNGQNPPTTVPGSPGDDCSHGKTEKDCRPDPNEHGKDCEDHGNARGNEDHCDAVETTTTTPTTETTTTSTTTTTATTPTTTTTPNTTTTTSSGSNGTPPPPSGNNTPSSGGSEPASESSPASTPETKPELQKELAHQVKGVQAGPVSHSNATPGELPFTGFPAWVFALIGSLLLGAGLGLRRLTS